jgi:hypothetical protein
VIVGHFSLGVIGIRTPDLRLISRIDALARHPSVIFVSILGYNLDRTALACMVAMMWSIRFRVLDLYILLRIVSYIIGLRSIIHGIKFHCPGFHRREDWSESCCILANSCPLCVRPFVAKLMDMMCSFYMYAIVLDPIRECA